MFAASSLQQYGIFLTGSAGKASFITGLYTVFVPVGALFMHKRVGVFTWIGVALSVTGLYLICMNGTEGISMGDIVLMIGTLFWTSHIIIIDYVTKHVPPIKFAMGQFFVCGAISLICALIFEDITLSGISGAIIPILYGGFMSVGVAYTCQIGRSKKCRSNVVGDYIVDRISVWSNWRSFDTSRNYAVARVHRMLFCFCRYYICTAENIG